VRNPIIAHTLLDKTWKLKGKNRNPTQEKVKKSQMHWVYRNRNEWT